MTDLFHTEPAGSPLRGGMRLGLASKSDFARRVGRSPAAVSHWIRDKKLHGAALVPTDRGEMIDVEVALGQLGMSLDLGQQIAQAAPILPAPVPPSSAPSTPDADEPTLPQRSAPTDQLGDDQRRLLRFKADAAETKARRDLLDLLTENGQWIAAGKTRSVWSKGLSELLIRVEAEFVAGGELLAAEYGIDEKAATLTLRRIWRNVRARVSQEYAEERDAQPAQLTPDEVPA